MLPVYKDTKLLLKTIPLPFFFFPPTYAERCVHIDFLPYLSLISLSLTSLSLLVPSFSHTLFLTNSPSHRPLPSTPSLLLNRLATIASTV